MPVIVQPVNDVTALEIGLVENVQRADLNPMEEAEGYQRLIDEFAYTQAELAETIGKSRSHIANLLRLTGAPLVIKQALMRAGCLWAMRAPYWAWPIPENKPPRSFGKLSKPA